MSPFMCKTNVRKRQLLLFITTHSMFKFIVLGLLQIVSSQDSLNLSPCLFKAHYSTGKVAASFTSTAMEPETRHEAGRSGY